MTEDQNSMPVHERSGQPGHLKQWQPSPVLRLMLTPAILILVLAGLVALNSDLLRSTAPAVQTADPLPGQLPGETDEAPYLNPGEAIRLGTHYIGDSVHSIVGLPSLYQGDLVLVNQMQKLPNDYAATDLMFINELATMLPPEAFTVSKTDIQLNKRAADALMQMIQDAYTKGIEGFTLVSGHRDLAYQVTLFQRKIKQYLDQGLDAEAAAAKAKEIVAVPGESEHHTGLALDLPSKNHMNLETTYFETTHGLWLAENAWRFGFIIRYPEDKTEITGISFEPWHLRYVGKPHSEVMRRHGWCLEEYIEVLRQNGGITVRTDEGKIWQIDYQLAQDGMIVIPLIVGTRYSGDGRGGFIVSAPVG